MDPSYGPTMPSMLLKQGTFYAHTWALHIPARAFKKDAVQIVMSCFPKSLANALRAQTLFFFTLVRGSMSKLFWHWPHQCGVHGRGCVTRAKTAGHLG